MPLKQKHGSQPRAAWRCLEGIVDGTVNGNVKCSPGKCTGLSPACRWLGSWLNQTKRCRRRLVPPQEVRRGRSIQRAFKGMHVWITSTFGNPTRRRRSAAKRAAASSWPCALASLAPFLARSPNSTRSHGCRRHCHSKPLHESAWNPGTTLPAPLRRPSVHLAWRSWVRRSVPSTTLV